MSILNRASDGLVSVLVALVRTSLAIGATSKQRLLDIASPTSLDCGKNDQDMATKTLNRWTELGLFSINEKGDVRLADEVRPYLKKPSASQYSIAHTAREIILASRNNGNFWSDVENKSADFTRAAAWMLSQDVHVFMPTSHSAVESACTMQASSSDVILLQNNTRWNGYVSWATFLGFGRSDSGKASGGFITDPTPVVRHYLDTLLPKRGEVTITDLVSGLAATVPVFDGGEFRKQVESKLKPDKWQKPKDGELSTSLSRSLLRLREAGDIRFESRSDADAQLKLIGREERVVETVTHVRRGEAT